MHPRYEVPKTYEVTVRGQPTAAGLRRLVGGIDDAGERLVAASAEVLGQRRGRSQLRIVVREGKKREVRRMCTALGCRVERLIRVAFGPLKLDDLPPGAWRELRTDELEAVRRAAGL